MNFRRKATRFATNTITVLLALPLGLGLGGCLAPEEEGPVEQATGETEQSLVVSNWSAPAQVSSGIWYPQIATLGGTTYMVHTGPSTTLRWRLLVGTTWTGPVVITGQTTRQRVSLAAFNGFLYMVRADASEQTRLWVSRFSATTGQWSTSFQIPHTSLFPPALAAFNNRLHLIGIDPSTKKLWSATMSADEVFTPSSPMNGHYSASRVSAAVANCKLYIAHRAGETTTIVYNSFNGTQWGYDQTIPAGPGGAAIVGAEPSIAERAGYLHLLHRDTSSVSGVPVWWTYFNGTSWASEVTIGGTSTFYSPVVTTGGPGLIALSTTYYDSITSSLSYTQPLPPFLPPGCFVVQPPIEIGSTAQ